METADSLPAVAPEAAAKQNLLQAYMIKIGRHYAYSPPWLDLLKWKLALSD